MNPRLILRLAFAALLLFGQYGALTHSVWHLGDHDGAGELTGTQAAGLKERESNGGSLQAKLCDLHLAMGSLLGGGNCMAATSVFAPSPLAILAPRSTRSFIAHVYATPPARAPPVLL